MLSPCVNCSGVECVLGPRKADCLAPYPNLRRIGNSQGGFAASNEPSENWHESERQFYNQQIERYNEMTEKKTRGRPAKGKDAKQATELLEALAFIECATGNVYDWGKFVRLANGQAIAYNGQMSAGYPIQEELTLCPQLDKLKLALAKCGKTLVISETPDGQLSVKGDKLRALVPCVSADTLQAAQPNPSVGSATNALKEAFKVCGVLASENGERVIEASLLLEANTCTGTNTQVVLQYWHGINMPPGIVLPKLFTQAIAKQAKNIVGFGFEWEDNQKVKSFTLWFENNAWIKTQCYADDWPKAVESVLNTQSYPVAVPEGLFEAAQAVSSFSDDDMIVFSNGFVMSHETDKQGAQYVLEGLQCEKQFQFDYLKKIAPYVKTIDLNTFSDRAFFFGGEPENPVRGIVIGKTLRKNSYEVQGDYNV